MGILAQPDSRVQWRQEKKKETERKEEEEWKVKAPERGQAVAQANMY